MTEIIACAADEMKDGDARRIEADPPIALYRVGDDFYATADTCTHEEWSLGDEGELDGFEITCTLHMARFDIRDGRPLCMPACKALRTFPVALRDGDVVVTVTPGQD